nr:MAG TPA: hypothetical protein [Caudoviricetes sp.]
MENIVSILSGLGVEIPQELVPALHKEIAENYKTVAEFQKLRKQLDRLKSGLPDTAASYSKLMVASNGRQSAVLLDGVMIGVGVDGIRLDVEAGASKLSITGIDVERFHAGNEEDFERFCAGLSRDELGGE